MKVLVVVVVAIVAMVSTMEVQPTNSERNAKGTDLLGIGCISYVTNYLDGLNLQTKPLNLQL